MWQHFRGLLVAMIQLAGGYLHALYYWHTSKFAIWNLPAGMRLSNLEKRRIRHYFFGVTYLSAIFCALRHQQLRASERSVLTRLSALAAFFDDLVEAQAGGTTRSGSVDTFGRRADERGIARHLLREVYEAVPSSHHATFQTYLNRVFEAEIQAQQGENNSPEQDQLFYMTAEKGGCSVLLFRSLLRPLPGAEETAALQAFGCLIQLSDDIFDLWFDHRDGIATVATHLAVAGRVGELSELFEGQYRQTRQAFLSINLPAQQVQRALKMVQVLVAITHTGLSHYRQLEKQHGVVPIHDRQMMVVDMEKWSNRIRAARFLWKPV